MIGDMRHALDERRELIEARANATLDRATAGKEPWVTALGSPPRDPRKTAAWRRYARTVAAYRDRYRITDDAPLGPAPENATQKIDHARARVAVERSQAVAPSRTSSTAPRAAAAARKAVGLTM